MYKELNQQDTARGSAVTPRSAEKTVVTAPERHHNSTQKR